MRSLRLAVLALLSISLSLVACSKQSKLEPRELAYTGTWKGTLVDKGHGGGIITATLEQDKFSVSGTWYSVFADDPALQNGGTLTGEIYLGEDTDVVNAVLKPQVSNLCTYKMTLTRTDDRLEGTYEPTSGENCHAGTVRMTKQP